MGLDEVHELRAAAQHVYVDDVLHRWVVELVRATREQESVVIGQLGARAASRSSARPAHGLCSTAAATSSPRTSSGSSSPVLVHRVVFTPRFVARARATGWAEAIEEFRHSCLELAPSPGSEEDPLFEGGVGPAGPRRVAAAVAGRAAHLPARSSRAA